MKTTLVLLALLLAGIVNAQQYEILEIKGDSVLDPYNWGGYYVTDSVGWQVEAVIDTGMFTGEICLHQWVYSERVASTYGCLVMHAPGAHCDMESDLIKRICRRCGRHELLIEVYYQHWVQTAKTEYETIIDSLRGRP